MNFPKRTITMSRPEINEDDVDIVTRALRSGQLSIGPYIEEFEDRVRSYVGTRYAVAVANGTAGLHLCMRLAGVESGAQVVTSPFSFVASANCIIYEQGTPVFVDIDETSFNIDAAGISAAICDKTVAILPIHIFGRPAAMDSICEIADKHSLAVVEDACEAIGTEYRGKRVGTFGKASVFAFYPNKQITTGEGAIITTDDPQWYAAFRSLRNQGRGEMGGWLDHSGYGFNYRLNEMSAALGVSQMSRIDSILDRRAAIAELYTERLSRIPGVRPLGHIAGMTRMSWFVYVIQFEAGLSRDTIAERMADRGIPTRNYFPAIHLQPYFKERFGYRQGQFPVTERVSASTLAVPFHASLTEADVDYVCTALAQAING